ncbi:CehA/McbA family metallohydrolase [Capillimicrobium parvum]|uniref:Polymerase/histidinol phosphatase N-terminal domain-containing protein n=1 Tax=Capillimicrobium parvum TaxID=2884022 RepID=A0A9E6Y018_9ACTN|nr:CehA/McbA family metallohydrolase [Capillimicrobium parvum]UGS37640.1 hypothetical protein DSM104329_04060 [Capillimicrobium parvum]
MTTSELTCVVHVHSVYSDGTGTISEIAAAAARAGADAVLVTDHDRMGGLAHAGWHGDVLVAVGVEVSPSHGSHLLAFGTPAPVRHNGRALAQILDAVHEAGGVGFAAHPFSRGGWVLGRAGRAAPWGDLRVPYDGLEVWSLVTDTLEYLRSPRALLRFRRRPDEVLADPPAENLAAWDALGARRRVPAIGGLDAHQFGLRRRGRVLVRTMAYERTFALLRTHVLLDAPPTGDAAGDTARVYAAMAAGRAFIARDSLADATGFRFAGAGGTVAMGDEAPLPAGGLELVAQTPTACELRLLRDGEVIAADDGVADLRAHVDRPGVYRVSAHLVRHGRRRTWILGNPIYLR